MARIRESFGSHANTAHVWAQQREYARGHASDRRMFWEGATIFSYGHHFALASFTTKTYDGQTIVLVNSSGYSPSTAKHKGYVRDALRGLPIWQVYIDDLTKWLSPLSTRDRAKLREEYHRDALYTLADQLEARAHGAHWSLPERDATAQYEATRVALDIKTARPKDVVAWAKARRAEAERKRHASKVREALKLVNGYAGEFGARRWPYDFHNKEREEHSAYECNSMVGDVTRELAKIGGARLTLAKAKRYPRKVKAASALLAQGKAVKAQWEAAYKVAVARETYARDIATLRELAEFFASDRQYRPAALNCGTAHAAHYWSLAIKEGQHDLAAHLGAWVQRAQWNAEVPATFKPYVPEGAEKLTPEEWYAGKGSAYAVSSFGYGRTLLRKRGDTLETSRGATCPWSHAVKAYQVAQECRAHGAEFKPNGRTIRVGTFQVDRIAPTGDLVAGCHTLTWEEMNRLAVQEVPDIVRPCFPLPAVVTHG